MFVVAGETQNYNWFERSGKEPKNVEAKSRHHIAQC